MESSIKFTNWVELTGHPKNGKKIEIEVVYKAKDLKAKVQIYHIRAKIYSKTAEKLTSLGVTKIRIGDPLANLVLKFDTNKLNQPEYKHNRFLI